MRLFVLLCMFACCMGIAQEGNMAMRDIVIAILPSAVYIPEAAIVDWEPIGEAMRRVLLEKGCSVATGETVIENLFRNNISLTLKMGDDEWEKCAKCLECDMLLRCNVKQLSIQESPSAKRKILRGRIGGSVQVWKRYDEEKIKTLPFQIELTSIDRSLFPNDSGTLPVEVQRKTFYFRLLEVAFLQQIWPKLF